MARKLKTFQTSMGFFDLAIAAPSMKAALEAWGSRANLFHQGFAKETDDPAVSAATMAQPGVVLKRAVGSSGIFKEDAELPSVLPARRAAQRKPAPPQKPKLSKKPSQDHDDQASRKAAAAFEKERSRRESERLKEEAQIERERRQRQEAVARAEASFEKARAEHDAKMEELDDRQTILDKAVEAEKARWRAEEKKLRGLITRARE